MLSIYALFLIVVAVIVGRISFTSGRTSALLDQEWKWEGTPHQITAKQQMEKNKLIAKIASQKFTEESFDKFTKPEHPQYKDYHDREHEMWHDKGYNNGIDSVIMILLNCPYEEMQEYLRNIKE